MVTFAGCEFVRECEQTQCVELARNAAAASPASPACRPRRTAVAVICQRQWAAATGDARHSCRRHSESGDHPRPSPGLQDGPVGATVPAAPSGADGLALRGWSTAASWPRRQPAGAAAAPRAAAAAIATTCRRCTPAVSAARAGAGMRPMPAGEGASPSAATCAASAARPHWMRHHGSLQRLAPLQPSPDTQATFAVALTPAATDARKPPSGCTCLSRATVGGERLSALAPRVMCNCTAQSKCQQAQGAAPHRDGTRRCSIAQRRGTVLLAARR